MSRIEPRNGLLGITLLVLLFATAIWWLQEQDGVEPLGPELVEQVDTGQPKHGEPDPSQEAGELPASMPRSTPADGQALLEIADPGPRAARVMELVQREELGIHDVIPVLSAAIADILAAEGQGIVLPQGTQWKLGDFMTDEEHPILRGSGVETRLFLAHVDRFPLLFRLFERSKSVDPVQSVTDVSRALALVTPEERAQLLLIAQLSDTTQH